METVKLVIQIPRYEIAFLAFILESYEGVATMRTRDAQQGIVELLTPPQQRSELKKILRDLESEFNIKYLTPTL